MEETVKRKTKTSSAVKNRYNAKMYSRVVVMLPKAKVAAFKEKCKATGTTQAQIVRDAVDKFLNE